MTIQDEYRYIGAAVRDYNKLIEGYQYYQKWQTSLKEDYNNCIDEYVRYEISEQMWFNKQELNYKTKQIKKLKKIIKEMNKEQNKKYNSEYK